jgi:hypothetical protein
MQCPIAGYKIDELGARWVAGFVVLAALGALLLPVAAALLIRLFLALDFSARAFSKPRLSPLARLAGIVLAMTKSPPRLVDAGPKRFAARIGLAFSLAMLASSAFSASELTLWFSLVLAFCASLESFLGFCLGCWMYTGWYALRGRLETVR